ncbi:MAG: hypothetical protein ACYDBB_26110 [Armatimonadota bacterium]
MSDATLHSMTVAEAAAALGVTESAIRMRIKRKTLTVMLGDDGLQRVTLPDKHTAHNATKQHSTQKPTVTPDVTQRLTQLEAENTLLRDERDYLRVQLNQAIETTKQQAQALTASSMHALTDQGAGDDQAPSRRRFLWWRW